MKKLFQAGDRRPGLSISHLVAVYADHRLHLYSRAANEDFIGNVKLGAFNIPL